MKKSDPQEFSFLGEKACLIQLYRDLFASKTVKLLGRLLNCCLANPNMLYVLQILEKEVWRQLIYCLIYTLVIYFKSKNSSHTNLVISYLEFNSSIFKGYSEHLYCERSERLLKWVQDKIDFKSQYIAKVNVL